MHVFLFLAIVALAALSGCASFPMYGAQSVPSEAPAQADARRQQSGAEQKGRPQVAFKRGPGFVDPKIQPYSVMGKTYWPVQSALGFREEGYASWYGIDFHGKKTATGEVYDMFSVSAAHKTLPLGTKVRVHNLENGRTLDLMVNDRGPFVDGRVIDLSYASARLLGMADSGVARVRVEGLEENPALAAAGQKSPSAGPSLASAAPGRRAPQTFTERTIVEEAPARPQPAQTVQAAKARPERPAQLAQAKAEPAPSVSASAQGVKNPTPKVQAAAPQSGGRYSVQVGAFSQDDNARRVQEKLVQAGFRGAKVTRTERGGKVLSVVQAGAFEHKERAEEALRNLKQEFPASFISTGA